MILRRLATAFHKQDWFTVVIETLIVMFGVFLGLQVNNWNQARFERADTHNVLERLERDFELQRTLTSRSIRQQELLLEATSRLITGIRAGELDEQTLNEDLALVDSVSTFPGPSAAFQELVSTGRMRLIANEDLRDKLYEFDSSMTLRVRCSRRKVWSRQAPRPRPSSKWELLRPSITRSCLKIPKSLPHCRMPILSRIITI